MEPSGAGNIDNTRKDSVSHASQSSHTAQGSQTAAEFIDDQLRLEADAREALPYSFDTCTQPLGPLRQMLFSCLTCNPPPSSPTEPYTAAGVCYSCSISCHGDHNLVELFSKRNFVCDCGTSRLPSTRLCTLRINSMTGMKGNCHSETPAPGNKYNHNFRNEYCSCNKEYNPSKENGIMLQCLGLASEEEGGCGEDWWDPECLLGLAVSGQERFETKDETGPGDTINRDSATDKQTVEEKSLPPGFPDLDSFSSFICWKCLETFPEFKRYAGTEGFLGPVYRGDLASAAGGSNSEGQDEFDGSVRKRKAEDSEPQDSTSPKRAKSELSGEKPSGDEQSPTSLSNGCRFKSLPRATAPGTVFSMFLKSDFRSNLCRCTDCFPKLAKYPQLLEEEEVFEQPLSESDHEQAAGGSSTGSLLERGERALNNIDRVRAIEGVMVFNDLKDKVKAFLQPFAESGKPVSAEDVKEYFEKLRGDAEAVKAAGVAAAGSGTDHDGANRREQSGY